MSPIIATVSLGQKLKQLRDQRGWSQREAATHLGIGAGELGRYERDEMVPRQQSIAAIIRGYNVSDSDAVELRRLAGHLKDMSKLINALWSFTDSDGIPSHFKDQMADIIEKQLAAFEERSTGRVDWAVIPIAGRHANELSIDWCAKLVEQTIDQAIRSHLHKFAIVVAASQENKLIQQIKGRFKRCDLRQIVQLGHGGLGGAVLATRSVIGHEPFALLLPDDFLDQKCLDSLLEAYRFHHCCLLSVRMVGKKNDEAAGFATIGNRQQDDSALDVIALEEKSGFLPKGHDKYWILGRYILTADEIFAALQELARRNGTAILELTDALCIVAEQFVLKGVPYPQNATWECLSPYRRTLREHIEHFLRKRGSRRARRKTRQS
jgi:UTP-glucose-1-phosphate uridylyltransferase/transcriptional regulator with XRE-family HTH domain